VNKYKTYKTYKINWLISGVNIPRYKEIEFYDFVKTYNIHALTFLNKWAETWCYTLTKAINSGLPIIYNNFGAFKERIITKEHYFKVYETENEIVDTAAENVLYNTFEKLLEYVITNNGKFPNITNDDQTKILYNTYYDTLLQQNKILIKKQNLVIITSKIVVSDTPFTYANKRSVYNRQQRFEQTLNTIQSIKNYIKDVCIVIFDNSKLSDDEYRKIRSEVDYFINITDDENMNYYTNKCKSKIFGETSQMIKLFEVFLDHVDLSYVENIFKISGRYLINKNMEDIISIKNNVFKLNTDVVDRKYYFTSFYKITKEKLNKFKQANINIIKKYHEYYGKDLEVVLPIELNFDFQLVKELGITQYISVYNDISNI
jgi:hypothetical protein